MKTLILLLGATLLLSFTLPAPIPSGLDLEHNLSHCTEEEDDLHSFLSDLGFYESTNNYKAINQYGYLGRYQFGMTTLRGLGYNITREEFLNSPLLQEEAMLKLLDHNRSILDPYIKKYDGKYIHGVKVTESGLLAAAHLVGPGKVKKFLYTGIVSKDGNNTKLTSYMELFEDYSLSSDPFENRIIAGLVSN